MTFLNTLLNQLERSLKPVVGETTRHEAETILQFVMNCSRSELYTCPSLPDLPGKMLPAIDQIIKRRLTGEPLAYILGSVYFYSKEILLTRDVLIPRPETEVLVETVLKREENGNLFFADIGTGSGAITAVLLAERPLWTAVASDISRAALHVALRNVAGRSYIICCDMLDTFKTETGIFDFLVCNPPYISQEDLTELDNSVIAYEPRIALYGGVDGLHFFGKLAKDGRKILKPHGRIYCEIGCDQGAAVKEIFNSALWGDFKVHHDLAGRPRVVTAIAL